MQSHIRNPPIVNGNLQVYFISAKGVDSIALNVRRLQTLVVSRIAAMIEYSFSV